MWFEVGREKEKHREGQPIPVEGQLGAFHKNNVISITKYKCEYNENEKVFT